MIRKLMSLLSGARPLSLDAEPGVYARREVTGPQSQELINSTDGGLSKPSDLGVSFYRKVRRMRRDPTVKMAREFTLATFLASQWSYDADDCAPEGAKEDVEYAMSKVRTLLLRSSVLGTCDYGWQPYEKIRTDRADGYWGFELKPLLQDITEIIVDAETGAYVGLEQNPLTLGGFRFGGSADQKVFLPARDTVLVNIDVEGTGWYGEPVMKSVEMIWDEQVVIQKSARKYDAKVAGSHWVVYYPLGTSTFQGQKNTDNGIIAKSLIENIESVGGIAIPRSVVQAMDTLNEQAAANEALMWKVELLSDKGSGQAPFIDRFKYEDVLKVRAFGWPERAMLEGQFGTKAEAEAHADVAILNMEGKHQMLAEQYNCQIVEPYLEDNYGPEYRECVKVKPAPLADRARQTLKDVYTLLLQNPQLGATELQNVDVKAVRDRIGVPELPYVATPQDDMTALDGFQDPLSEPLPPVEGDPQYVV